MSDLFYFTPTDFFSFLREIKAPLSFLMASPISTLHTGHWSAMAHRASSSAPCVCCSGSALHWLSMASVCLSQPSSRTRLPIQGWARTQSPRACRLSLHSSAASSQLSAQPRLTLTGPGLEPESRAPRRNRRAEEKNRLCPASTEPGKPKSMCVSKVLWCWLTALKTGHLKRKEQ